MSFDLDAARRDLKSGHWGCCQSDAGVDEALTEIERLRERLEAAEEALVCMLNNETLSRQQYKVSKWRALRDAQEKR